MKCQQHLILMSPGIRSAVVRICETTDTGLISVIDCRSTRPCHLDHNAFPEDCLIDTLFRSLGSQCIGTSHLMICSRQETGMIMVGQFIHCHLPAGHGETGGMMPHSTPEALGIAEQILPVVIAVFLHTGQKPGHGLHECIVVHNGIPFISL